MSDTPVIQDWLVNTRRVLHAVEMERCRQVRQYGIQRDLPNGTGERVAWLAPLSYASATTVERAFRDFYEDYEEQHDGITWSLLVREELAEAFQEGDPVRLRQELLQVAALCVSWVEALDINIQQHQEDSQSATPITHSKKEI